MNNGENNPNINRLFSKLDKLGIKTETVEHEEVFTVEQMMPHVQHLEGIHTKNLFLVDKKKSGFWLLCIRHDLKVNLNQVSKQLSISGGLRLASEEALIEKLGVKQGCVSAFALINDLDNSVKLVLDAKILEGGTTVFFHPLSNAHTTGISIRDLNIFLKDIQHEPLVLTFD